MSFKKISATKKVTKSFPVEASDLFIKNLPSTKGLPKSEEYELILRAQKNDRRAMDDLVMSNIGYIRFASNKVFNELRKYSTLKFYEDDASDCFQCGVIGFMRAVEKYKDGLGSSLCSYAYLWIRQSIQRAYEKSYPFVSLGSSVSLLTSVKNPKRSQSGKKKEWAVMPDLTADDNISIVESKVSSKGLIEFVFNSLTMQERYVVLQHLGIGADGEKYTQRDLAKIMGINRNRVGEIYSSGLGKIRRKIEAAELAS